VQLVIDIKAVRLVEGASASGTNGPQVVVGVEYFSATITALPAGASPFTSTLVSASGSNPAQVLIRVAAIIEDN
jgi:hypothetical protein